MPLTISNLDALRASLKLHEGLRLHPYADTTGHLTIGWGHDLTDDGIGTDLAELMLSEDISVAMQSAFQLIPFVALLDDVRKRAFVEIVFNMGDKILTFHDALGAAKRSDWPNCVAGFKASLWSRQVGSRAIVLESMLLTGLDPQPLT